MNYKFTAVSPTIIFVVVVVVVVKLHHLLVPRNNTTQIKALLALHNVICEPSTGLTF